MNQNLEARKETHVRNLDPNVLSLAQHLCAVCRFNLLKSLGPNEDRGANVRMPGITADVEPGLAVDTIRLDEHVRKHNESNKYRSPFV